VSAPQGTNRTRTMTIATAKRNIEGITRCLPEVEKLIDEAKANGNKKHEEAQSGYLMSLKRQLEIYKQVIKKGES